MPDCSTMTIFFKKMIKLAIFDLDGTLLNTLEDLASSCNYALRQCGCPERETAEYNMLVGRGITNLFTGALPEDRRRPECIEEMRRHFLYHYNSHQCDFTKPYEGIIPMLDTLSGAGIALAVASNKYQEGTENLVRRFFGRYDFACILGQRPGKPAKPDPEVIFEAVRSVPGTTIEEAVYCGDSDVDMQTGINAGILTAGAAWGFRTREELEAYRPWIISESPDEICSGIMEKRKQ